MPEIIVTVVNRSIFRQSNHNHKGKQQLTSPPRTDIPNILSMSVFVVFKHRYHENGKRSERMNQLHEDLLYVKSLVTAMGNLNQEEVWSYVKI